MGKQGTEEAERDKPLFMVWLSYFGVVLVVIMGYLREFAALLNFKFNPTATAPDNIAPKGYAPLLDNTEYFYTRRMFGRMRDCWDRPITGPPGAWIKVLHRDNDMQLNGQSDMCLNLGSYNYLGFGGPSETLPSVIKAVDGYGVATASPSVESGYTQVQQELEEAIARFIGKEDAIVFEMGYATNSTTIPALISTGGLILSDSLNHASIVQGCRNSGAKIRPFAHNDPVDLEQQLITALRNGQDGKGKPWDKILIVVEGVYSMEGELVRLPEIINLKKKYKAYLYLDEAHSIGATGPTGRGVCEHWGVNPSDIDIMMGTFTKSFASVGGYVAASKEIIDYLRTSAFGMMYATSMSPPCAQQALAALHIILGEDGTTLGKQRIEQLKENSDFFRNRLRQMGFKVLGQQSPIIPVMFYHLGKMPAFSRLCLERKLAVVVVGFPATPLQLSRVRFCISAAHTRDELEWALKEIEEVGDLCMMKYMKGKVDVLKEFGEENKATQ